MTKINLGAVANPVLEWVQKNQEQIKTHPTWQHRISASESEALLNSKVPFTYLLRSGETEHLYFISFVTAEGSIKHQFFVLEHGRAGWYYRNGGTGGPQEIVSEDLNELIPLMMHCDSASCSPLQNI